MATPADQGSKSTVFSKLTIVLEKPLDHGIGELIDVINGHGGEWGANMSKKATHIVSNGWDASRRSFKLAESYGVPVVTEAWLHECIKQNALVDTELFKNDHGKTGGGSALPPAASSAAAGQRAQKRQRLGTAADSADAVQDIAVESQDDSAVLRSAIVKAREAAHDKSPPRTKGAPAFPTIFLAHLFDEAVPNIEHQRNGTLMTVLGSFVVDFVAALPGLTLGAATNFDKINVGRVKVVVPPFKEDSSLGGDRAACLAGMKAIVVAYDTAFSNSNAGSSAATGPGAAGGPSGARGVKRPAASSASEEASTLNGKTVCFTGVLSSKRADVEAWAQSAGARVVGGVSKNIDILVAGLRGGSKLDKAKELNKTIWTEEEFLKAVGQQ